MTLITGNVEVVPCAVEGCERGGDRRRGWCDMHYGRWWAHGDPGPAFTLSGWVNPLVCVCDEPQADPRRNAGMCDACKRKPRDLLRRPA